MTMDAREIVLVGKQFSEAMASAATQEERDRLAVNNTMLAWLAGVEEFAWEGNVGMCGETLVGVTERIRAEVAELMR